MKGREEMARKQMLCMCIAGLFAAAAAGCGDKDKGKGMAMSHDGKPPAPPPRPAEMDKLSTMIGNWTFSGSCTMPGADKPIMMTGTSNASWAVDRWCIVENVEGPNMMGPGMFYGMAVHTYDPHDKKFKSAWMDNMGSVNHGEMWQDGPNTWKTKGTGRNATTGETTTGEGWMKIVDANTIEWGGTEYAGGKKLMEMKGTNKRKM